MSTHAPERAESGSGAGGTQGPSGSIFGGSYGDPAPAVFALPFLGWLAFADAVADAAPGTAGLMTAAAYLAQSALEERLPNLIGPLGELLTASGFSSGAVDNVHSALLADRFAFTPQAVTDELAALYSDLGEERQLLSGEDPLQLVEAAIAGFLDSDRVGPDARIVYEDMADRADRYRRPHWRACCSLDLPSVLGTGKPPIYCARRGHRIGDRLVALEWTYGGTLETGFKGKVAGRGPVGQVNAGGGYRDSIDDAHPNYYWDTLAVPSSGLAFGLNLSEGRTWLWANKVAKAIDGRRAEIGGLIDYEIQGARANISTLLTAAQLPAFLLHPVVGLMVTAVKAVVQVISAALVKTLSDKSLTTWAIWHTAVMSQRRVPISVFTVSLPGEATPRLQYLHSGEGPSAESTASDDYSDYPVFMRQARFMIGASEPPHGEFNDALFGLTDRSAKPLAWREPLETNSGFRILAPHRAPGTKASYVSALRVDVQLEEGTRRSRHWRIPMD